MTPTEVGQLIHMFPMPVQIKSRYLVENTIHIFFHKVRPSTLNHGFLRTSNFARRRAAGCHMRAWTWAINELKLAIQGVTFSGDGHKLLMQHYNLNICHVPGEDI